MFFNDANDRMIVVLEHNRVFIYQNLNQGKKEADWKLLRQIDDYPFYFDNFSLEQRPAAFSDDFKLYITYNRLSLQFSIYDGDTGKLLYDIPLSIMSGEQGLEPN